MLLNSYGNEIQVSSYPNNESNFKPGFQEYRQSEVTLRYESDTDLFHLMMLKKFNETTLTHLKIAYMPYSRMDRDLYGFSNCSLRYVGEFIKNLGFESIRVMDPHSELTLAYLGRQAVSVYPFSVESIKYYLNRFLPTLSMNKDNLVIMFPDAGAQKRYTTEYNSYPQLVGYKHRDFTTGKIMSYEISNAESIKDKVVMIVDDLCSYGGTFIAAAKELRKFSPKAIVLVVSHCENSILNGDFTNYMPGGEFELLIDAVYTTDSILSNNDYKNFNIYAAPIKGLL